MTDVKLWVVLLLTTGVAGCERVTAPARPARAAAPMVEVAVRRFDSLEWPLEQRRIRPPKDGVLETLTRILRFPGPNHPVTGIEIRDSAGWEALWAAVAPGDSTRGAIPFVDFPREMVYVVVAETREDWPLARIDIDRVLRTESRYSVYATTRLPRSRETETRLVDAVVMPAIAESVTLFVSGALPSPPARTRANRDAPRAH